MKLISKLSLGLLALLPTVALSENFYVQNNTNEDISIKINHLCSSEFGVAKFKNHTIGDYTLQETCGKHRSNCSVKLYVGRMCHGKTLAHLKLNIDTGWMELKHMRTNYTLTNGPFYLVVSAPL